MDKTDSLEKKKFERKYADLTWRIIKCAMAVHRALGNGYPERIYQRAMAIEMDMDSLSFEWEKALSIYYRDKMIGSRRMDFLVEGIICVELKAKGALETSHINQTLNYLEAYNLEVGLLINFGERSLNFRRLTNKKHKTTASQSSHH